MQRLLVLVVLPALLLFANLTHADCPDLPVECDTATFGWQGSCYNGGVKCDPCGPRYCPPQPTFDTRTTHKVELFNKKVMEVPRSSIALLEGNGAEACRAGLIERKWESGGPSACSIPPAAQGIAGMANLVFGKDACVEHDICYAMVGMNQQLCDHMFLDNMVRGCNEFYYKHLGDRDAIKVLNVPGAASCRAAARMFFEAVKLAGASSFQPSSSERKLCEDVQGPPKVKTSLYVSGYQDRIDAQAYKGKSDKPGKVKVCLVNKSNGWKGLHFKEATAAKYETESQGDESCGHYWPGMKTFYFWEKRLPTGKKQVDGLPIQFDLTGYAGYRIDFKWYEI